MLIEAKPGMPAVISTSSGGFLFVQVSGDCLHGAMVTIPAAYAVVTAVAAADDHLPAVVVIDPRRKRFGIEIRGQGAPFEMMIALS